VSNRALGSIAQWLVPAHLFYVARTFPIYPYTAGTEGQPGTMGHLITLPITDSIPSLMSDLRIVR
jgi:hypothetical protein